MSYVKPRRRGRPSVTVRPLAEPNQIEIQTRCPHASSRSGWQLGEVVTERVALSTAVGHHIIMEGCDCLVGHWARYRTEAAPADILGMARRFNALWQNVEAQQQASGFALLDWAVASAYVRGAGE